MNEREAFTYGYLLGSRDTIVCGMEMSRAEAETAYDEWCKQGEVDPLARAPIVESNVLPQEKQMEISLSDLKELIGNNTPAINNKMIGKYVLVRCSSAGVHCGVLESYNGQQCVLTEARRLWYWKPKTGAFLSSVAEQGLDDRSKVGEPQRRIHLTENCEIAECSLAAEESIRGKDNHNP